MLADGLRGDYKKDAGSGVGRVLVEAEGGARGGDVDSKGCLGSGVPYPVQLELGVHVQGLSCFGAGGANSGSDEVSQERKARVVVGELLCEGGREAGWGAAVRPRPSSCGGGGGSEGASFRRSEEEEGRRGGGRDSEARRRGVGRSADGRPFDGRHEVGPHQRKESSIDAIFFFFFFFFLFSAAFFFFSSLCFRILYDQCPYLGVDEVGSFLLYDSRHARLAGSPRRHVARGAVARLEGAVHPEPT